MKILFSFSKGECKETKTYFEIDFVAGLCKVNNNINNTQMNDFKYILNNTYEFEKK